MSAVLNRTRRGPIEFVRNIASAINIRCQLHWLENDCTHLEHDIRDNPKRLAIKRQDMHHLRNELARLKGR